MSRSFLVGSCGGQPYWTRIRSILSIGTVPQPSPSPPSPLQLELKLTVLPSPLQPFAHGLAIFFDRFVAFDERIAYSDNVCGQVSS